MATRRIPLWLKIGFTLWVAVWVPFYWDYYGPVNFLWFCDIANFLIAAALWAESPLLLSWQAVSILLVQILWVIDFVSALTLDKHPIGGTGYMFSSHIPIHIRLLSLFHLVTPFLLLWGVRRIGYDRRAFWAQTVFAQVMLPISWIATRHESGFTKDINWVWGVNDEVQHVMPPIPYLLVTMIGYPIVLYLPSHFFLRWWGRRPSVDTPKRAG